MGSNFYKCSLVLLTVFITVCAHADEHFPFVGKINSDGINVRAGASTNYERIDQIPLNTEVVVLAHQYEWYQIQLLPTAQLYIREDYLKKVAEGIAEVQGDRVNVRARANSESAAIGQLTQGTLVLIKETTDHWTQIVPPKGLSGWVNQRFIILSNQKVPDTMMLKAVTLTSVPVNKVVVTPVVDVKAPVAVKKLQVPTPQVISIAVEGFLKPVVTTVSPDIKYQLLINNKPAYYLKDAADLSKFETHLVKVVGDFTPSSNDKDIPVVHVTGIAVVK